MLAGAHSMDEHFRAAPLDKNIPVLLGFARHLVWQFFFAAGSTGVFPYDQYLHRFPAICKTTGDGEQWQKA